ncbi:MAG: saccharopine dehydrogenase NADP-binding domain-containing protein [Actinobacteria bacterium]|nr:saccharopine dehydrogenase NADP-binding domain-containing protein [Actinomycetota bacterium]
MAEDRDYDLVLLGATGFTGGLVAEDLARQLAGDDGLRWAVAGRDRAKLETVRDRLEAAGRPDGIEVVDVHDRAGLTALTRRTRALATTVGPYARHGEGVVAACIETGTDYVDITGEPAFVNRLLRAHGAAAQQAGVRIVNCCGFDSIPHDLGAQLAVAQLPDDEPIELRGFVSARGRFSGGTFTSAIEAMADTGSMRGPRLDPGDGRRVGSLPRRIERVPAIDGWGVPLPTIDPMVVLRSAAALRDYGPSFRYGHFARTSNVAVAGGMVAGVGAVAAIAQLGPGRSLLHRLAPDPGDGPDEETRAKSRFRVTFLGRSPSASTRVEVRGGDPGYTETSKMLAEAARSLIEDRDALPERAGVLTTAVAFGPVLRQRLEARGISFAVV